MSDLDILLPGPSAQADSWHWGTVTATSPLRVRLDGDAAALAVTPSSLNPILNVGGRVWCQLDGTRLIVHGPGSSPTRLNVEAYVNQTGPAGADWVYAHAVLTIPASGWWMVTAGATLQTNTYDAQSVGVWITGYGEASYGRGKIVVQGVPPAAAGVESRPVVSYFLATQQLQVMVCRNGGSTASVLGAGGVAGAPGGWLDAVRLG